jgi:predicted RNA-binding protein with RPS1 domain
MQKNNRTLNQEHERRQEGRVRPKQPAYDFEPLQAVINQWVRERLNTQYE